MIIAAWCNGSTIDSESVSDGSNPSAATMKCKVCGNLATHWSRHGDYIVDGKKITYERKLKNGYWIDPILEKYWDKKLPTDMRLNWYSVFYCFRHITSNAVEL